MSKTKTSYILLTANIDNDIDSSGIFMPLSDTYTLNCENYTISKSNIISQTSSFTQETLCSLSSEGALTIKAQGNIYIDDSCDFIIFLTELSSRKTPFTLTIGNNSFENMILKNFSANIEKYSINSECKLEFIQL